MGETDSRRRNNDRLAESRRSRGVSDGEPHSCADPSGTEYASGLKRTRPCDEDRENDNGELYSSLALRYELSSLVRLSQGVRLIIVVVAGVNDGVRGADCGTPESRDDRSPPLGFLMLERSLVRPPYSNARVAGRSDVLEVDVVSKECGCQRCGVGAGLGQSVKHPSCEVSSPK